MKKINKKGFTLVELIVVIAIIGILAAVLVPSVTAYIGKAQKTAAIQTASNRYEEFTLALVDQCYSDVITFRKEKNIDGFFYGTNGYVVLIDATGYVSTCDKKIEVEEGTRYFSSTKIFENISTFDKNLTETSIKNKGVDKVKIKESGNIKTYLKLPELSGDVLDCDMYITA